MGFPAYKYGHKNNIALQILSVILGGNMSSRLFLSVREKNGLAYYVHSSPNNYEDAGLFHIQAGLDKQRIKLAIELIIEELKKVVKKIDKEEIQRAKDYIAGKMAIDLEDSSSLGQWYTLQELMIENIMTPEERLKLVTKTKAEDVLRVAKEVLNLKRINLAIIGPFKDDKQFKNIISKL